VTAETESLPIHKHFIVILEVVVDFLSVQGVKTAKRCTTENCYFFANNQQGGSINARPVVFKGEGYIFASLVL
jgi:hypothetical protein